MGKTFYLGLGLLAGFLIGISTAWVRSYSVEPFQFKGKEGVSVTAHAIPGAYNPCHFLRKNDGSYFDAKEYMRVRDELQCGKGRLGNLNLLERRFAEEDKGLFGEGKEE